MTRTPHILWADDEIDLLKPHILFLQGKGYDVSGFTDGASLLEALEEDRTAHQILQSWDKDDNAAFDEEEVQAALEAVLREEEALRVHGRYAAAACPQWGGQGALRAGAGL